MILLTLNCYSLCYAPSPYLRTDRESKSTTVLQMQEGSLFIPSTLGPKSHPTQGNQTRGPNKGVWRLIYRQFFVSVTEVAGVTWLARQDERISCLFLVNMTQVLETVLWSLTRHRKRSQIFLLTMTSSLLTKSYSDIITPATHSLLPSQPQKMLETASEFTVNLSWSLLHDFQIDLLLYCFRFYFASVVSSLYYIIVENCLAHKTRHNFTFQFDSQKWWFPMQHQELVALSH